jgi:hypothetical protein
MKLHGVGSAAALAAASNTQPKGDSGNPMNIDIVNFARYATHAELRWFVGRQLPLWLQDMLRQKASKMIEPAELIDQLAAVCSVTPKTKVLD